MRFGEGRRRGIERNSRRGVEARRAGEKKRERDLVESSHQGSDISGGLAPRHLK